MMYVEAWTAFVCISLLVLIGFLWTSIALGRFIWDKFFNNNDDNVCDGHHFEKASSKLIELRRPDKSFSIVLEEVHQKCQHQGCSAEYIDWEIDRFIVYGDLLSGGFYLGHNVKEAVEKLTNGRLKEKDISSVVELASRPDRMCEVPIEKRGKDEHERD